MDVTELFLAVPFLSAGDLPALAAVSKGARQLARNEYQSRLKSNNSRQPEELDKGIKKHNCWQLEDFLKGFKKQEIVVYDNKDSIPPWYYRCRERLDFRQHTSWWLNIEEDVVEGRNGQLYLKIKEKEYRFPIDQVDPYQETQETHLGGLHCSYAKDTIVVIGYVRLEDDGYYTGLSRNDTGFDVWGILYRTTSRSGSESLSEDDPNEPVCMQQLTQNMPHDLVADKNLAGGFLSGNGESLVVTTDLYDGGVDLCTLTVYEVTQAGFNSVDSINLDWCSGGASEVVDVSVSTCGQLLSLRNRTPEYELSDKWILYDLRSGENINIEDIAGTGNSRPFAAVETIFFTIDNEIIVKVNRHAVEEEFGAKREGTSSMAQYVQSCFRFLEELPSAVKRVIIL